MNAKILAAVLALASQTVHAGVINNGDFNNGLASWTPSGSVHVVLVGGNNLAQLTAGMGTGVATTLSQTVHLMTGDVLNGSAKFLAFDAMPYNDNAFVDIHGADQTKLFSSDVKTVGDFGTSGWTNFSYTAPAAGDYTLEAGVANQVDNGASSSLQVDNFTVTNLPEPASLALLGLGLFGIAAARRNRRR